MKENYNAIGLMSGTSLDGLDIVYVSFFYSVENQWSFKIKFAKTVSYPSKLKEKLANSKQLSGLDLMLLNNQLALFFGKCVTDFIAKNNIKKSSIDFIASHGHTVFHQSEQHLTTQIGSGAVLAATTNLTTISDFRSIDVALGGHGAPLVPIGDKLLFAKYDYCLNIGGIANISYKKNKQHIAFDVCPANLVLNALSTTLGKSFDEDGKLAASGKINKVLLKQLNLLAYYNQIPPKSLGSEWIENNVFPLLATFNISVEDKLCTFSEHIAIQLSKIFTGTNKTIFATGGGVLNLFLVERIKLHTKCTIVLPNKQLIEFKEALIFAFLGVLRYRNEVNCLASVTGAKRNNVGGSIYTQCT